MKILYEDGEIIVVIKPAGMDAQSSRGLEKDMVSELKNHLAVSNREPYLGIVHRLDKPVEGIMVFAKSKKAAAVLSRDFQGQDIKKRYLALVHGCPSRKEGELFHFIRRNAVLQKAEIFEQKEKDAKDALLSYKLLDTKKRDSLVLSILEIELFTGRFHQIRAQLAYCGMPIWGDKKYHPDFAREEKRRGIGLAAVGLEFSHSKSGKRLVFSYTPEGEIWNFSENGNEKSIAGAAGDMIY